MAVLGRSTGGTIEAPVALHLTASFFEGFDVAMAGHAWADLYRRQLSRRYSRLAYDGAASTGTVRADERFSSRQFRL